MASHPYFSLAFLGTLASLSFYVANADGYHSRVTTLGSWDSPQQLIAMTCLEQGEGEGEPTFHAIHCSLSKPHNA